jgi:HK97 family phage major capsid protein
MSDAAARALAGLDLDDLPATREEAEDWYAEHLWRQVEAGRDRADRKAAAQREERARLAAALDDIHDLQHAERRGPIADMAFLNYLATGRKALEVPGLESKADLVSDDTGRVLLPADLTVDVLREAARVGVVRRLASVRPTVRDRQTAGLIGSVSVGWGKLETGTTITDAAPAPVATPGDIEVWDVQAEAQVGVDLLDDAPEAVRAAIVEAIGAAIGESAETKFLAGDGDGEPAGLALAANVTRVPAGQKVAVSTSNTPTAAQLLSIPWKLPARYRDDAVWLLHPTSAEKVGALTFTNGDAVWPNPGPDGPGLLGWPAHVVDGLPDPATAGTTDASIWFVNLERAYRVVERQRVTVQVVRELHALDGYVGLIVRARMGGDLVRPEAACIYTQ